MKEEGKIISAEVLRYAQDDKRGEVLRGAQDDKRGAQDDKGKPMTFAEAIRSHVAGDRIGALRLPWLPKHHLDFVKMRHDQVFKEPLIIDNYNLHIIKALCYYFSGHPDFEKLLIPTDDGKFTCYNWKLKKGLLIMGDVGSGKTHLMRTFMVNKRENYRVVPALTIATEYTENEGGYNLLNKYKNNNIPMKGDEFLKYSNEKTLWKTRVGLCIDDLGTEQPYYLHMGNKAAPIAEIITARYDLAPQLTHMTTNLSRSEIMERYGARVFSRIMQNFNLVVLTGPDRRMG